MDRFPLLAATALLTLAGAAQAHPRLVSATPAPSVAAASPARVELHFSERLMPQFSKADLLLTNMTGRAPTKLGSTAAVGPDGRTLVVTPTIALRRGRYSVDWRVVSTDTHRVAGTYTFAVK